MENKKTIEQSNPFIGVEGITYSNNDIRNIHTKVVSKAPNGIIVPVNGQDTTLIQISDVNELEDRQEDDNVDILLDGDNNVQLDRKEELKYINLLTKTSENTTSQGKVIQTTEKGLLLDINGLQCFMPSSQIDYQVRDNISSYLGETIDMKLISLKLKEKEGNRFLPIVSHKAITEDIYTLNAESIVENLAPNDIITGTVKTLTQYGAFVTIAPQVDGLIHITDISWKKISHPSDVLSIGQTIKVTVLDIEGSIKTKLKLSLGVKQLQKQPWDSLDPNLNIGDIIVGKVCNIADYGIFIRLSCGVEGLIHRTELDWHESVTSSDFHKEDSVTAKIISLDRENKKMLLSIKQTQIDPWIGIEERFSVGSVHIRKIVKILKYGLFVEMKNGITGLLHISELSWTEHIKKPQKNYDINQLIEVVVLSIDYDKKQLELSHKRLFPNPWEEFQLSHNQFVDVTVLNIYSKRIEVIINDNNLVAFIPINESDEYLDIEIGQNIKCVVNKVDIKNKKIELSQI